MSYPRGRWEDGASQPVSPSAQRKMNANRASVNYERPIGLSPSQQPPVYENFLLFHGRENVKHVKRTYIITARRITSGDVLK